MKRNFKSGASRGNTIAGQSLAELAENAGKLSWSKAAGRYMPPSKPKHIDPSSPEGRAIAARYASTSNR